MVGTSESCVEALAGVETGQQSYFLKGVFAISRLANHALGIAQPIAVDQGVEVVAEMCGYGFGYVAWVDGQLLCYPTGGETGVAISSAALQHFAYLCIQRPGACLSLAGGLSGGMFTLRCHGVGLRFRGKGTKRRWKTLCRNAFSWWKISPALSKLFRCSVRNILAFPQKWQACHFSREGLSETGVCLQKTTPARLVCGSWVGEAPECFP